MSIKFGIELETISTLSQSQIADLFNQNGINAREAGYSSTGYNAWQMKSDGSIICPGYRRRRATGGTRQEDRDETRPTLNYRYGVELVSRVMQWNATDRAELERAIDTAAPHVTVNTSCGFHVHVSAEGLTAPKLARLKTLWNNLQPIVFSYLPPSRRHNNYCRPGIGERDRYYALNLTCLPVKGTVEFRCHHGTMNKKKILSWIAFCIALVEYAKGDDEIPTMTVNTDSRGEDFIEVTYRGRAFRIVPTGFNFTFNGIEYRTLKDAALAVVKSLNPTRVRPLTDRFINRNVKRASMENGGMAAACRTLRVDSEAQDFLIERYDLAVRTWGLAN